MKNRFILILLLFLGISTYSQVKLDSLFEGIDTLTLLRKKLSKYESISKKNKLSNREINTVVERIAKLNVNFKTYQDSIWIKTFIGNVYWFQNKGNESLKEYFDALKIAENHHDIYFTGFVHNHIADGYDILQKDAFSQRHLFFALKYLEQTDSIKYTSDIYNAIGIVYKNQSKLDSALKYHEKALAIRLKLNNKIGVAYSYNNIGLVYLKQNDLQKSEQYLKKSLTIKRELKDDKGTAGSLINLGDVYMKQKKYDEAKKHFEEGSKLAYKAKAGKFYRIGIENTADMFFKTGEYKDAALYYIKSKKITDSLKAEETQKEMIELTTQYESEKKDAEIALQQEQLKSQLAENTKQKIMIFASGIALLMMIVAIFFVYRSYKQNKRNAELLSIKNHLIEEKNKEITDSINYAKLIQQSLLASKEMLDKNLESYFILYKPKDIVSGDFYWASESKHGFLIACVDCTGHGVPGAFMSLIGKENLDKAASKTINPGEILQELNINVKRSLNQTESSGSRDGMDAVVLRVEKNKEGNANVFYSGANRPLYILKHLTQTIEEIKATKQAIGGLTSSDQKFEEHNILVDKGDTLVITTDGYADQFGSDKNKKLTTKRFKELLVTIQSKNSLDQRNNLENFFNDWKGKNEQLDDLLVIGINI